MPKISYAEPLPDLARPSLYIPLSLSDTDSGYMSQEDHEQGVIGEQEHSPPPDSTAEPEHTEDIGKVPNPDPENKGEEERKETPGQDTSSHETNPPQPNGVSHELTNGDEHVAEDIVQEAVPNSSQRESGSTRRRPSNDHDAQAMVIDSLRQQVQDLISQVTALNGKLVKSYDRFSDLEDALHVSDSNLRTSTLKISQLELERTQHLSALNTGLLVEKAQVTSELTRLMEKATDEAARRGQAESARAEIEQELDDLSAGLFDQANTMVAEARLARAMSERKAEDTERALKETEEVVGLMQKQMQALQEDKEEAERRTEEMKARMGKGKWVDRTPSPAPAYSLQLLSSHQPYQEFLLFVAHLRSIRPTSPQMPAMTTLLPLPFLSRLLSEDTDPTVRLDLAPSLNWLTRRSVMSAIHNGQLSIEPIPAAALLDPSHPSLPVPILPVGSNNHQNGVSCALCGTSIFSFGSEVPLTPTRPGQALSRTVSGAWSASLFKNSLTTSQGSAPPSPPPYQSAQSLPSHVFIFRLSAPSTTGLPVLPQSPQGRTQATIYPLCTSSWCLSRLRSTCSLWAFVRAGIIEKVWEEEVPSFAPPPPRKEVPDLPKPPVPPRRKSKISGLWGMASALGGWSDSEKEKEKEKEKVKEDAASKGVVHDIKAPPLRAKKPFLPPPTHPASGAPERSSTLPPPLPKRSTSRRVLKPKENEAIEQEKADDTKDALESKLDDVNGKLEHVAEMETSSVSSATPAEETDEPSRDAFLTPTEQPSSPVLAPQRSASPSTIPLPESAPATPVGAEFSKESEEPAPTVEAESATAETSRPEQVATEERAESSEIPSETTTEAPAVSNQVDAVLSDKDVPSRTSSPAPPLPRRAPGRNRPVPPPPPPRARGHGATPAPSEAAVPADALAPTEATALVDPTPAPADDNSGDDSTPSAESATDAKAAAEISDEPAPTESDTSKPASEDAESTPLTNGTSDSAEKAENDSSESQSSKETEEPKADDAPAKAVIPPALPPRRSLEKTTSTRSSLESKKQLNGDGTVSEVSNVGPDGEIYVGDATWEERAWKELVRLREEMFWARVGGVR
ncbi:hypothetical protein EVG20_g5329 [Dentipellis fragilis]|uniref:GDP/GTP exchange factor Sec2 N-terminal domain-containing protein n=1 Tax=Dentipellis fragilis TaxID=205917 RepID=A0A4Y9YTN8_9AGAM|nr:hypothetical protein EVG20_g5329 [Dentipellis fragilis]